MLFSVSDYSSSQLFGFRCHGLVLRKTGTEFPVCVKIDWNDMIVAMAVKQPWVMWVNESDDSTKEAKQSTTKLCAYFILLSHYDTIMAS